MQTNLVQIINQKRKENHTRLFNIFKQYEEFFILPKATELSEPSWFAFAVTIKNNNKFKRKDIVEYLESNKIQTRPYFAGNIMLQPAYNGLIDKNDVIIKYPNARKITTDTFFLGTSPVITSNQLDYVEDVIKSFIKFI